eukprot:6211089-Pleurochrysis_carterae.AAC.5
MRDSHTVAHSTASSPLNAKRHHSTVCRPGGWWVGSKHQPAQRRPSPSCVGARVVARRRAAGAT